MRHSTFCRALLSIHTVHSCASQPDHNFMVTFDNDRRNVFGVRKNSNKKATTVVPPLAKTVKDNDKVVKQVSEKKVVKQVSVNEFDMFDFDRAEKDIFDNVENVEKAILKAAGGLIHDEVDVLFGADHGGSIRKTRVVNDQVLNKKKKDQTKKSNRRSTTMADEDVVKQQDDPYQHNFSDFMFE